MAEVVKYIGQDALAKLIELIKAADDTKVDKVEGMGLTHNDVTDELLEKINTTNDTVAEMTEKLGTIDEIKDKLDNGGTGAGGSVDMTEVEKVVDEKIAAALEGVTKIDARVPEDGKLPTTGEPGVIYMIPAEDGSGDYEQYIWDGESYIPLGKNTIDLTDYLKNSDVAELTAADVVKMWG